MPVINYLRHLSPLRIIPAFAISSFALTVPSTLCAANIVEGDVTNVLGPTFFVDDVTGGGSDTDIGHGSVAYFARQFNGLLTPHQGPTRIVLTGFGFFTHTEPTANDATTVAVTFTYLGADGAINGGDDVSIGTASGSFTFSGGKEYVFTFDTPLVANLNITATRFLIQVAPTIANYSGPANTALKLKTGPLASEPSVSSAKLSVAGVSTPLIIPQRVNLAKFQTMTPSSVAGNRLAAYATDGFIGNDNRWQSDGLAWNTSRIDFPFPVEIGSAQLFTGFDDTSPLGTFGLQYLVGTTWVNIAGASVSGNTNVERNLVFTNPITATSFRLIAQEGTHRIREWALYPPNGPSGYPLGTDLTLNLAHQRPAVASSHTTGNYPLHAVDGRTHLGSSWQTTTAGLNTLEIEMVANMKLGSAHLYSGSSAAAPLADFTLKYWNGTTWLDIPGGAVTGNTSADRIITFTTPTAATKVRLEFTKTGTTPTVIRELQIFPANTGNVGYPLGTNINPSGAYADYEKFNDAFYQITNPTCSRDIAIATGGQPALELPGVTKAQAQYQVLLNVSNGTYRLRNRDTGNCLSGSQLSKAPGAALTDAPYVALPHQDWILQPFGSGLYQIVNAWSGLVIDTLSGSTAQGTALVQNTASDAATQRWKLNYDTWAPKKGLGHGSAASAFNAKWMYNWGPTTSVTLPANMVFHPMQWGSFNWVYGTTSGPIWQHYSTWRKRGDGMHVMGFNEPDRTDQSNITLAECVNLWPRLMALDQPLIGPSPGTLNPPAGPSWHQQFYDEITRLGYRVDYNAIHTYPGPSGGSSNNLVNMLQTEFTESGRPAWLTEFSFVDWGNNQSWTEEDNYQCLAEFLWRAETLDTLRKYALFVFTADASNPQPANPWSTTTSVGGAPRSNSYDSSGNLTAFGKLYAGWDGDVTVRADKTYMIHHKGTRKRLANLLATAPDGQSIRIDGQPVNWTLVSTGVTNRYYVVSSRDGRRLSSNAGAAPTLAAAGTTGVNVEWSLTASQNGWYYLGHPASSRRLQLAHNNTTSVATYTMVAATTTGDAVDWRFIVPLPIANAAPVLAAVPAQTVNEGALLTFTATATDADLPANTLTYTLSGAPAGAAIASSTGVFTWTPTEAQGPGAYNFAVRVSDGSLIHEQPVTVTVSELNVAPVLAAVPAQTVNEGVLLNFTASATDADLPANTLTYSLVSAPTGAAIVGSTGVFSWTPTGAQGPGSYTFTVRVSDGALTHNQSVTVTVNELNVAPVLAAIPAQTVSELTSLTFTASATDADLPANTLTYSLIGAPVGASMVGSTGVFTWTPTEDQGPGTYNFTVRVSDGALISDQPVSVTVSEANLAPMLATIAPQAVEENSLLTFTASATDADLPANTLTYSLIGAPAGASIHGSTGIFTWTPTAAQGPGSFNLTVRVSDGNLTHDQPVSINVSEPNTAPVLAAIPSQTVSESTLLTFTASATDADLPANTLTYSLVGAPAGATIASSTGVFNWTPTETQGPALYNFTVRVSDGSLTVDRPVAVTVTDEGGADHLGTWIVAGQSNAEGYGITENPIGGLAPASTLATIGRSNLNVTHTNIQMFQGANDMNGIAASAGASLPPRDTWHAMTAQEGLAFDWGSGRGNESRRRFGPELAFGYDVQRQVGSPIALIKYARGSSSIAPSTAQSGGVWRDYDPSDGGRLNQYDKLISTIQAAVNSLPAGQVLTMRGVVWMQGESDATAAAASSYQANLTELIASLRADIGAIAAASGGKMTRSAASWSELDVFVGTVRNTTSFRQTVINAQNAVAAADANVFAVNGTTDLSVMTVDDWGDSGVHYDTAGQVLLGERFADAAISRLDSGVQVTESGGATSVTEGGTTDTYTVTLTRAPSADVTISITTDPQVSVSPTSLTFTAVNWATPQTVMVTAVNDTVIESNHSGSIGHSLSSSDLSFGGLPINGVTASIIDNDFNTAPVLAAIPPQTVKQGNLLTFTASATDTDLPANTLTYSLIGEPAGAAINGSTGVFTWTPTEVQGPGSFNFSVRVSDGNLNHDRSVLVTVESPLPSPEVDSDGDGLSDLLEFAFLTNPALPNGNPFRVIGASGGSITLEFPWNRQAAGLSWQIRHGQDLSNIATWPVVAPGATVIAQEGNIDRITISPNKVYADRGFYVLEVIGN